MNAAISASGMRTLFFRAFFFLVCRSVKRIYVYTLCVCVIGSVYIVILCIYVVALKDIIKMEGF